jgi:hypothetical protein
VGERYFRTRHNERQLFYTVKNEIILIVLVSRGTSISSLETPFASQVARVELPAEMQVLVRGIIFKAYLRSYVGSPSWILRLDLIDESAGGDVVNLSFGPLAQ